MSTVTSTDDGTMPEESGEDRTESDRSPVDYGDRWECPACGNHSKVCYRYDSCGHDFADDKTTAAHYELGEIGGVQ